MRMRLWKNPTRDAGGSWYSASSVRFRVAAVLGAAPPD